MNDTDLNAELMRRAATALSRAHPANPWSLQAERQNGLSLPAVLLALALLLVPPVVAVSIRFSHHDSAFITDASAFVHANTHGESTSTGHFFVTSVTMPRATGVQLVLGRDNIRSAQRNARDAAVRCMRLSGGDRRVRFKTHGHIGASGGLIYALQIVDAFDRRDVTAGRRIAGTGTISPTGEVGPILEIALKAQAAEHSGASLFLAPADQAQQARASVRTLPVVGIRTLDEAVKALTGGRGCR